MPGPADTYIGYGRNWANVSNTPFREYKHFVHEGGIATPLIAYWPKGIEGSAELRHQPSHLIDLMATCVDVAGATYPTNVDGNPITPLEGKSLLPAFRNEPINRLLYWEHEGHRAIRDGKWKLVAKGNMRDRSKPVTWELYDLSNDRSELQDLSTLEPVRLQKMIEQWHHYAVRTGVYPCPVRKPKPNQNRKNNRQKKDSK